MADRWQLGELTPKVAVQGINELSSGNSLNLEVLNPAINADSEGRKALAQFSAQLSLTGADGHNVSFCIPTLG